MKFRIIPHQRADAAWHLALEEALFLKAKDQLLHGQTVTPIIRMYSFDRPSVILGYQQRISEIDTDYCNAQNIRVTMRSTGGGSVYLGTKDLQYSLLLPFPYSKALLATINQGICYALQDCGFHPSLTIRDQHPVLRMNAKSFVFDAERRFKTLLLHHGTTLVDDSDYDAMPQALKATPRELHDLRTGNLWLSHLQQTRETALIKSFEKNLPHDASFTVQDFTTDELRLAKKLYETVYTNEETFRDGHKRFGICYLPSTRYNMEDYATEDQEAELAWPS